MLRICSNLSLCAHSKVYVYLFYIFLQSTFYIDLLVYIELFDNQQGLESQGVIEILIWQCDLYFYVWHEKSVKRI